MDLDLDFGIGLWDWTLILDSDFDLDCDIIRSKCEVRSFVLLASNLGDHEHIQD